MTQEEMLEMLGKSGIHVAGDLVLEKHVENEIGNVENGGIGIQIINSEKKSTSPKTNKKSEKKPSAEKPKTVKYYIRGNNGVLLEQRKRVNIVFRKLNEWGWIDEKTPANDFDAFFEGEPRHCNITWTANSTILTILLQELLEQSYITKQTGCSAKSLVKQQFGKSASSDRNRLDKESEDRIKLILLILDTRNPLPEPRERNSNEEYDVKDAALKEIFAGNLRSTKGI